jgi:hypothetical protein
MTHDVNRLRKPVQSTWQKSPIMFPTKAIDEYRLGCLRSALWCLAASRGLLWQELSAGGCGLPFASG